MHRKIIRDYIAKKKITVKAFADFVGINQETLFRYFAGRPMSPHIARKIEKATKGELTFEMFKGSLREFRGRVKIDS